MSALAPAPDIVAALNPDPAVTADTLIPPLLLALASLAAWPTVKIITLLAVTDVLAILGESTWPEVIVLVPKQTSVPAFTPIFPPFINKA